MQNNSIQKVASFDPDLDYITDGQYVWQENTKYPISVLQDQIDQWFDPKDPDTYLQDFISDMQKAGWAMASIAFASLLHINVTDYIPFAKMGQDSAISQIRTIYPNAIIKPSTQDTSVFETRSSFITSEISQSIKSAIDNIVQRGVQSKATYGQMHDSILQTLGINPNDPIAIGFRAERIARNEAMFAVRMGMLQEYEAQGVQYFDLITMAGACAECIDIASGNPYTLEEAVGYADGIHVNCRCIWQAAMEQFTQSLKNLNENDIIKIFNL